MRKMIAAMNMSLDGFCDHRVGIADAELHQYYTDLLNTGDTLLYGRITYQLMEDYWPSVVKKPTGEKTMDDFALAIDKIEKIVFSRTLKSVDWKTATLKKEIVKDEILELKRQTGRPIFVGSPGLIASFTQLGLIDEYQLCVHPIIAGSGPVLFKGIKERVDLKLQKTRTFGSGVVAFHYERIEKRVP